MPLVVKEKVKQTGLCDNKNHDHDLCDNKNQVYVLCDTDVINQ